MTDIVYTCKNCGPLTAEHVSICARNNKRLDGSIQATTQTRCLKCHRANQLKYRNSNAEKSRATTREWQAKNKEYKAKCRKQWKQENPDKHLASTRAYRERNPEKYREHHRRDNLKMRSTLSDGYVVSILRDECGGGVSVDTPITPEIIEARRALIMLNREIRKQTRR